MEITINYNGRFVSVEVSAEVYEYLDRADHKTENLAHEQRRHWDGRELDEYIIAAEGLALLCHPGGYNLPAGNAERDYGVLALCTEKQRERFLLHALYDLSYEEVGKLCGCSKGTVQTSINTVKKKFQKFWK